MTNSKHLSGLLVPQQCPLRIIGKLVHDIFGDADKSTGVDGVIPSQNCENP